MMHALGFLSALFGIVLAIGLAWLLCGLLSLVILAGLNKVLGGIWMIRLGLLGICEGHSNWTVDEYLFGGPIGFVRIIFCLTVVSAFVLWTDRLGSSCQYFYLRFIKCLGLYDVSR